MFEESEASSLDTQVDKADSPGNGQYCAVCNMWLDGPEQLDDHIIGKRHVKNTRRAQQRSGKPVQLK